MFAFGAFGYTEAFSVLNEYLGSVSDQYYPSVVWHIRGGVAERRLEGRSDSSVYCTA